jgi:hypothetical protein
MEEPEKKSADSAIKWLLEVLAAAFVAEAVAGLMRADIGEAVGALAIGIFLSLVGFFWASIKQKMPKKFSDTVAMVACDFRYWLAILLVAFLYLGYPNIHAVDSQTSQI